MKFIPKIILVCTPFPQPVVYPIKRGLHLVLKTYPKNHFGVHLHHFGVRQKNFRSLEALRHKG